MSDKLVSTGVINSLLANLNIGELSVGQIQDMGFYPVVAVNGEAYWHEAMPALIEHHYRGCKGCQETYGNVKNKKAVDEARNTSSFDSFISRMADDVRAKVAGVSGMAIGSKKASTTDTAAPSPMLSEGSVSEEVEYIYQNIYEISSAYNKLAAKLNPLLRIRASVLSEDEDMPAKQIDGKSPLASSLADISHNLATLNMAVNELLHNVDLP